VASEYVYATNNGLLKLASIIKSLEGIMVLLPGQQAVYDACSPDDGPTANTIFEYLANYAE